MVYDDYADIGIFAKWVMDLPGLRRELLKIGQYQDRNANEKLAALPLLSNP